MKTLVCFAVTALAYLLTSSDAVVRRGAKTDSEQCAWTDPDTNVQTTHPVGSSWATPSCTSTSCLKRDGEAVLATIGCGLVSIRPSCQMSTPDPSKPYPDCCHKEVCP